MSSKTAKYNTIFIIQSLNEGRTGSRLYDDLKTLTVFTEVEIEAELIDVNNKSELIATLVEINRKVQATDALPLIHFETHGGDNPSGIILSSGEFVDWQDIERLLTDINQS